MAAGYLAIHRGLFERAEMRVAGKYVINPALSALLFNALPQRSLGEVFNPVFIAAHAPGSLAALVAVLGRPGPERADTFLT